MDIIAAENKLRSEKNKKMRKQRLAKFEKGAF